MRPLATWLPWSAAIAFGALAAAGLLSLLLDFRTAFPYALGLSALVGVPMAMRCRGGRAWGRIGTVVAAGVVVLLDAGWCASGGTEGQVFAMLLLLVGLAACLAFVGVPAAALVLALSGEWLALPQGTSVADLPHGRLRVAVLLLLTVAPLALYTSRPGRDCEYGFGVARRACDGAAAADGLNH
jgi:hypothetical protein